VISREALLERLEEITQQLRDVTSEDVQSLARIVREGPPRGEPWAWEERFWFSGTANVGLPEGAGPVLRSLWTRTLEVLAANVLRDEPRSKLKRNRLTDRIDRIAEPRRQMRVEGDASAVLERGYGKDVWAAVIAIWNASCAALLSGDIPADLSASLEQAWRQALSRPTPRDGLSK